MPMKAREAALKALVRVRMDGAWSDAALNSILIKENLEERDKSLASRIFYGVVQNLALCDFYISVFSSVRPSKMEPRVLDILRLSVYQLVFLSKIPVNAAVHEGVELTKKYANPRAAGLVNAVLRKLSANLNHLPDITAATVAERLSVKYSHPRWLVEAFIGRLGETGAEDLLKANNSEAPITVNINALKADALTVISSLQADNVEAALHPWLKNSLELRNVRQIDKLDAFRDGAFYVQDPAAILAVKAASTEPGMNVIDGCAAPGGKSFAAAIDMKDTGAILSCDINEKKLRRIEGGARRLGLSIVRTRCLDASASDKALFKTADVVIADVPCSGFGVIRKKPEIRYKTEQEVSALPELQLKIISNLSDYVKPGGVLLYSTCTLLQKENEDIIKVFLENRHDFRPEPFLLPEPIGEAYGGMITLWPHIHETDGFFICRLRRQ